jgi:uncharacterized protein DUF6600
MSPVRTGSFMFRTLFPAVVVCLALGTTARAQSGPPPAYLAVVDGTATLERNGEEVPAVQNMPFVQGDRLRTAAGRVQIAFPDGSAIEVDEYSEVECVSPTRVRLLAGTMDHVQRDMTRSTSASYLPPELDTYGTALDQNGAWQYEAPYGYVWYPSVATDWRPYYYGYWAPVPSYGWTWVGVDSWAWPTHHYGRWGYASNRWFWIPGRTWGPAWVSWASANDYVSWCPLGFDSRPVFALSIGSRNAWAGWTVLPRSNFGVHGYYANRHAVDARRIPVSTPFIAHTAPPLSFGRSPRQQIDNGRVAAGGGIAVPRQAPAASRQAPIGAQPAAAGQQTIDPRWSRNPQGVQTHYGIAMPRPAPNQPAYGSQPIAPSTQQAPPQYRPAVPDYRVPNGNRTPRMDPRATPPAPAGAQPNAAAPSASGGGMAVPRVPPAGARQAAPAPGAAQPAPRGTPPQRSAPAGQPAQGQAQPRSEGQAPASRRPR